MATSSPSKTRIRGKPAPKATHRINSDRLPSLGLWNDITTMRWMTEPFSSFKLLMIPIMGSVLLDLAAPGVSNPFKPMLFLSYRLPDSGDGQPKYAKGPLDLLFIAYYVIVFSFIRQSCTLKLLHPLARKLGIKKPAKLDRFGEQGYAVIYFSFFGSLGVLVMSQLPTWWFRTEHFWLGNILTGR